MGRRKEISIENLRNECDRVFHMCDERMTKIEKRLDKLSTDT